MMRSALGSVGRATSASNAVRCESEANPRPSLPHSDRSDISRKPMADFPKPASGAAITMSSDGVLSVPDNPIIPFIEGDGTGPDIWRASVRVLDASVERAYG